jgi:hypothetical protein
MDKKKFSKITALSLGVSPKPQDEAKPKKIIATKVKKDLRETFRKTFLPLLIDVFELKQMVSTYKLHKESPELRYLGKVQKKPTEVLKELEEMHNDVEETLLWCNGVMKQVSKAMQEAKQVIEDDQ